MAKAERNQSVVTRSKKRRLSTDDQYETDSRKFHASEIDPERFLGSKHTLDTPPQQSSSDLEDIGQKNVTNKRSRYSSDSLSRRQLCEDQDSPCVEMKKRRASHEKVLNFGNTSLENSSRKPKHKGLKECENIEKVALPRKNSMAKQNKSMQENLTNEESFMSSDELSPNNFTETSQKFSTRLKKIFTTVQTSSQGSCSSDEIPNQSQLNKCRSSQRNISRGSFNSPSKENFNPRNTYKNISKNSKTQFSKYETNDNSDYTSGNEKTSAKPSRSGSGTKNTKKSKRSNNENEDSKNHCDKKQERTSKKSRTPSKEETETNKQKKVLDTSTSTVQRRSLRLSHSQRSSSDSDIPESEQLINEKKNKPKRRSSQLSNLGPQNNMLGLFWDKGTTPERRRSRRLSEKSLGQSSVESTPRPVKPKASFRPATPRYSNRLSSAQAKVSLPIHESFTESEEESEIPQSVLENFNLIQKLVNKKLEESKECYESSSDNSSEETLTDIKKSKNTRATIKKKVETRTKSQCRRGTKNSK